MEKLPFARVILGSASPRRKSLLQGMGIPFEVVPAGIEEVYPHHLQGHQITDYLALEKARSLKALLEPGTVVLTADTIVWFRGTVLEKPGGPAQAVQALKTLSGQWHEVITSVCFSTSAREVVTHAITAVKFAELSDQMIEAYVGSGQALDKAGAYGIQEWIGLVGVEGIKGSYTNVVGLPTQLVYKTLRDMAVSSI
jgi:septum formation protein